MTGFTHLPDLASRDLAGSVCATNDEFFAAREAQDEYINSDAGSTSPADQLAQAKALLASGSITQDEYAAIKAKALA